MMWSRSSKQKRCYSSQDSKWALWLSKISLNLLNSPWLHINKTVFSLQISEDKWALAYPCKMVGEYYCSRTSSRNWGVEIDHETLFPNHQTREEEPLALRWLRFGAIFIHFSLKIQPYFVLFHVSLNLINYVKKGRIIL